MSSVASGSSSGGTTVSIGNYNAERRREEVFERLRKFEEKLKKEKPHLKKVLEAGKGGKPKDGKDLEDVNSMSLTAKQNEIDELETLVKNFLNPDGHFTKEYRTLQGHCGKLQTELDAIDVSGREDLRMRRKEALIKIDKMTQALASKAHSTGEICEGCEVKE